MYLKDYFAVNSDENATIFDIQEYVGDIECINGLSMSSI
jgi:hypothetical protein